MRFDPTDYVDVQERINQFWVDHPDGAINCDLLTDGAQFDAVVVKAFVYVHRDDMRASATGLASEERGADYKAGANLTSWHENCETSAIGRALANLAYAKSRKDRPSRQEMQKVERGQASPAVQAARERQLVDLVQERQADPSGVRIADPMTDRQMSFIRQMAREKGLTDHQVDVQVQDLYGKRFDQLDRRDAAAYIERMKTIEPLLAATREGDRSGVQQLSGPNGPPMSDKQRGFLISLAKELGMVSDNGHHDAAALNAELLQFCGLDLDNLTVGKAKEAIDEFVARRDAKRGVPANEPHPAIQQAIDNTTSNWITAMEGAATMAELSQRANEATAAKQMTEPVRAAFNKRRDQLQSRSLIGAN